MDSRSQDAMAHLIAGGLGLVILLLVAMVLAFAVFLYWRILSKAGLPGALGILAIIPFGAVILLCILAFSRWNVVPAERPYSGLPPYPPPPAPPQNYPQS